MTGDQSYAVLMADMVKSRALDKEVRLQVQLELEHSISFLNEFHKKHLLKPVMFSAGDEVQGLFTTAAAAYLYYRQLTLCVWSICLRGGIGIGTWQTQMPDGGSTMQDGTAYHHARNAIEAAKRSRNYQLIFSDKTTSTKLNIALNSPINIITMRTSVQATMACVVELMAPISLEIGTELDEATVTARNLLLRELVGEMDSICTLPFTPVPASFQETKWPRAEPGIAEIISRHVGKSRQSVDKNIAAGLIYQERAEAALALSHLMGR